MQNIYEKFAGLKEFYIEMIGNSFLSDSLKAAYSEYIVRQYGVLGF